MKNFFLLISHLKVHNANALSSYMTIGTPSLTAFLGFVHALERKLPQCWPLHFSKVGICLHNLTVQQYRGVGDDAFSLIGTSNPLDKKGERPSFVEEARCDLEVSLVIQIPEIIPEELTAWLKQTLLSMKFAGGDIEQVAEVLEVTETNSKSIENQLTKKLMPGFWLIDRTDLMKRSMSEGEDAMQALLSYLSIHVNTKKEADGNTQSFAKKESGWLIPIAVGFQGLTPVGFAENQRDCTQKHRFAEPVITLGEYKMVHRLQSINEVLWAYHFEPETNLYLCQSKI